jgi:hypothetical protein
MIKAYKMKNNKVKNKIHKLVLTNLIIIIMIYLPIKNLYNLKRMILEIILLEVFQMI